MNRATRLLARRIGLRHARAHRLRAGLTVAGIAAGVALVFSILVMNTTLTQVVTDLNQGLATGDRIVVTAASSAGLDELVVDSIESTEGVAGTTPLVLAQSRLGAGGDGDRQRALVVGVPEDLSGLGPGDDAPTVRGDFGDGEGLLLSESLARQLGVDVGSTVQVGEDELHVTGTVGGGSVGRLNDGMVAALQLPAAQELFGRDSRVDAVVVTEAEGTDRADLEDRLTETLDGTALVDTSVDELANESNVRPFAGLTTLVGLVSLVVAAVVVLNTTGVAVSERRRELALARVLGATPRELRRAVLLEAAILGAIGSALGLAGGWLLAQLLVARADQSYSVVVGGAAVGGPAVEPNAVGFALVTGVLAAVVGALVPARRTLRMAAVEPLRPDAPMESSTSTARRRGRWAAVGLALLAIAFAASLARDLEPDAARGVSALAVVALLLGAILLVPTVAPALVRRSEPLLGRLAGPVGRMAGDELRHNPRRVSTEVALLMVALTLVIGLAGTVGALVARFNTIAHHYISSPVYVEADSTIGYLAPQPIDEGALDQIADIPGVTAVLPGQTAFVAVDGSPAVVYANPLSDAEAAGVLDEMEDRQLSDDPAAFEDGLLRGDITMSERAAESLGLAVGDRVELPTPTGPQSFDIAATYSDIAAVPTFIVDRQAYVEAWGDGGAQRAQVMTEPGQADAVVDRLERLADDESLPIRALSREAAIERNGRDLLRQFQLAEALQWGALVIAAMCIAVTFFTSVVQRRWEHALQRLLGVSQRQLARALLIQAAVIGVLAWLGAVALGLWLSQVLSEAASAGVGTSLPVHVPVAVVAVSLVAGVLAAVAAASYPARVAARTQIAEVLRGE